MEKNTNNNTNANTNANTNNNTNNTNIIYHEDATTYDTTNVTIDELQKIIDQ